jgi:uncharacterized membrane protein
LTPEDLPAVEFDLLGLIMRWMHILGGMLIVGGILFVRLALLPASGELTEEARKKLQVAVRAAWAKWVHIAIALLLLSGIVNLVRMFSEYKLPPLYHALFTVKLLLALAIFFLWSMLVGRSPVADRFREKAPRWMTINLVMAVTLVCISGVLRGLPRVEKPAPAAASRSASQTADTSPTTGITQVPAAFRTASDS